MLKKLVGVILLFSSYFGLSQEEYGIAHSNYAPTKTFLHNPTNTLDNKVWLDIHVVGAGAFIHNNYVFLKGTQFSMIPDLFTNQDNWPEFQFKEGANNKRGYQELDLQLLSATYQYKRHGFGFSSRIRQSFDFRRLPGEVAQLLTNGTYDYDGLYGQVIGVNKMFINQMAFLDLGFSYSNQFYHFAHETMGAGITLKYLMGFAGAGIKIDDLEYNVQNPLTTEFYTFNGTVASGTPGDGISGGSGVAVDLGFVYKKTLHNVTHYEPYSEASACEPYDYKYKLSAAIVDFGYINFNKNATRQDVESSLSNTALDDGALQLSTFDQFVSSNFTNITTTDKFRMLTPAAINVMGDYNFENYYHLSGYVSQAFFRRNALGVKRPSVWAVTGRYQRKWFEGSGTISMMNFNDLRLGVAARFGYLTIGTDKLISYLGVRDFYGTDFYFNLRYFLSKRPGCKRKEKKGKLNATDCVKN